MPNVVRTTPTSFGFRRSDRFLNGGTSCASGVTVVNIDNGFGAGYAAGVIALGSRVGKRT